MEETKKKKKILKQTNKAKEGPPPKKNKQSKGEGDKQTKQMSFMALSLKKSLQQFPFV